ncbi:MAG: MFS transporter [Candidatus Krumholzibacteriia bacterium]
MEPWRRRIRGLAARLGGIEADELGSAVLAALLFFCILCGYYILRPVREEMGLAGGVDNLPYLYVATLAAMLVATPVFGALVKRYRREVFVPAVLHFFAFNLLIFLALLHWLPGRADVALGRAFYVWVSVFNMFAVSLFWSLVADGLGLARSKRLFGFIAVGGTLGAWLGSGITAVLVEAVGRQPLLLVSVVFLELAVLCTRSLAHRFPEPDAAPSATRPPVPVTARPAVPAPSGLEAVRAPERNGRAAEPGGSMLGGIALTLRSTYLLAVGAYLFLYSVTSTFLYFEQANLVALQTLDRASRVAIFARIDVWVNLATLVVQLVLTGRVIRRIGTGWTLATLPLATAAGFLALGLAPTLAVLVAFKSLRSVSNYALAKPARETLFAILDRNGKYKAKNFLDTFVRRGGDVAGAGAFGLLTRAGVGLGGVALLAIPVALIWAVLALYLGREQNRRAAARTAASVRPTGTIQGATP